MYVSSLQFFRPAYLINLRRPLAFELRATSVQSQPVQLALISRRSRYRAGTRYNTRGVDASGNVGNFNETEQILIVPSKQATSFIQTRGSAPFYWSEIVNLIRVPDLIVMDRGEETRKAFKAHIDQQKKAYGNLVLLNLVKARGREKHVKDAYEELATSGDEKGLEGVRYEYFDLHSETSGGRWTRIDQETDALEEELVAQGCVNLSHRDYVTLTSTLLQLLPNWCRYRFISCKIPAWSCPLKLHGL